MHSQKRIAGWLGTFETFLLAGALAATLTAGLLAGRNGLVPSQHPLTHGLVFGQWILLAHLAVAASLGIVVSTVSPWPRARWLPRVTLLVLAAKIVWIALWSNAAGAQSLLSLEGPARFRLLLPASFALACLGFLALAVFAVGRRWVARSLTLLAVAAALGALAPAPLPPAAAPPVARHSLHTRGERLLFVGIDGADWRYIEQLIASGDLPNLQLLRENGVWGPLQTIQPTESPRLWTTIATGTAPETHRIGSFTRTRLRGVDDALGNLRPVHDLGVDRLLRWLRASGRIYESPIGSGSRRAVALWELTSAHDSPIDVVNWWATWPAEPILGHVVSDPVYFWRVAERGWSNASHRLTHPPELYNEIAERMMTPRQVGFEHARAFMNVTPERFEALNRAPFTRHSIGTEFKYFFSMFETNRRIALFLMEKGRRELSQPRDMLLLLRLVDLAGHTSMRASELVEDHLEADEKEIREFGGVVSEAYRSVDRLLGELLTAFGEGNVVVVSDHGFEMLYHWPDWWRSYGHNNAPDGIFLAAGPAFAKGRVDGLSIYDIMPLLAYLKELPIARDLPGRLAEEAIAPDHRARHPPRFIASYGPRSRGLAPTGGSERVNREVMERLRALGYLQ